MGTLLKFYEDISLNVTADKSHKNFHLVSQRVSLLLRFLESNSGWKLLAGNQNANVVIINYPNKNSPANVGRGSPNR